MSVCGKHLVAWQHLFFSEEKSVSFCLNSTAAASQEVNQHCKHMPLQNAEFKHVWSELQSLGFLFEASVRLVWTFSCVSAVHSNIHSLQMLHLEILEARCQQPWLYVGLGGGCLLYHIVFPWSIRSCSLCITVLPSSKVIVALRIFRRHGQRKFSDPYSSWQTMHQLHHNIMWTETFHSIPQLINSVVSSMTTCRRRVSVPYLSLWKV